MALLNFVQNFLTKREGLKEYQEKLRLLLSDGVLSDGEQKELEALAKKYNLTKGDLVKLQKAATSNVLQSISSDNRITEEERSALNALINYFGLDLKDINFDQESFNKYYSLALIEKGVLPQVQDADELNMVFKPKEVFHCVRCAVLKKLKRVTRRINYSGLTGSIRIARGVRFRVGSLGVGTVSDEVLSSVDVGIFYLTNQRLGYLGKRKQFAFPYEKILSLELTPEGMYLFKEGKEVPYILKLDDYDVPSAIVSFILNR